jgi:nucleoid DNA-binding protein
MKKKHIRKDIANWLYQNRRHISQDVRISRGDTDKMAICFIECLRDVLSQGCTIELRGLGTFSVKDIPSGKAWNINKRTLNSKNRKDDYIAYQGRKTVHFHPSDSLLDFVNNSKTDVRKED